VVVVDRSGRCRDRHRGSSGLGAAAEEAPCPSSRRNNRTSSCAWKH
jgi:hypothetical protein